MDAQVEHIHPAALDINLVAVVVLVSLGRMVLKPLVVVLEEMVTQFHNSLDQIYPLWHH
jgi:hypothetical protein|tara:strand:+ start:214 stop:390 length:177 start_codon:yes stop_codon:yes gene_type:complete